ncbi:MAG: sigma-70 family RNA polymerase sigma factor [Cyanobacteria bacterium HKST-UBA03]|nr:sigma-70 family RNA polymerase sigma factor [Cyanobacteria bacterium HKST-UBA05]MCA9841357.1 sigma-70 family RNA polymerase sigma factor [Cyanobacteria bacterium HKST-UBA03]
MAPSNEEIFNEYLNTLIHDYISAASEAEKARTRDEIVEQILPYVRKIAGGLARRSNDPVDDLTQVGSMGLIKALDKYNPLAGSSFKTYATYLITGEIRHYLRDKSSMVKAPRQIYELYYRMNQIVQQLTDEFGRPPNDLEIAEALDCTVEKVKDAGEVDRRRTVISLDQFVVGHDGQNGDTMFIERLVDESDMNQTHHQENRLYIEQALASLKEELRVVVKMTYYDDMSQMEIASVLGISQMQVSRRLRKALDLLHDRCRAEMVLLSH